MTTPPRATRCPYCGTVAAEWICHICKREKPTGVLRDCIIAIPLGLLMFWLLLYFN